MHSFTFCLPSPYYQLSCRVLLPCSTFSHFILSPPYSPTHLFPIPQSALSSYTGPFPLIPCQIFSWALHCFLSVFACLFSLLLACSFCFIYLPCCGTSLCQPDMAFCLDLSSLCLPSLNKGELFWTSTMCLWVMLLSSFKPEPWH